MIYLPYSGSITTSPKARRNAKGALVTTFLIFCTAVSWGQNAPPSGTQATPSLAPALKRVKTENTQLHFLYVHGMGTDGPGGHASADFRKSLCKYLRDCTTTAGESDGTDYADTRDFVLDAPPPEMKYLGHPLWGNNEEWNASAPYVDHYKLVRNREPTIYVDEINWWPLVFAAKCRQIVAEDASLAGPIKKYIDTCSLDKKNDPDQLKNRGRFLTYPFITNKQELDALPAKGAKINRALKTFVLDWGFADAVLAVGPLRRLLLEGIGEVVLKSVKVAADGSRGDTVTPAPNQEFVIISHSLGSYLMFSALDIQSSAMVALAPERVKAVNHVLGSTSKAYFLANQVRLLELANLDVAENGDLIKHLTAWSIQRHDAGKSVPEIVAWSDPSDLLTWSIPALDPEIAKVQNETVQNARHWFWLIENPGKAHTRYDQNKRVIKAMLPKLKHGQEQ
jgi:hypothetical protein